MLVLTRRKDERIILVMDSKAEIVINVCEIRGEKVRIGVSAPDGVKIWREEVWEEIKKEKST